MPIVTKTVSGVDSELGNHISMVLNMAKSLAASIGTTHKELTLSTPGYTYEAYYYVPMDSIGYDGFCVDFHYYRESATYHVDIGIRRINKNDGAPDLNDDNFVDSKVYRTATLANTMENKPETCVMICDNTKDTVLFDIHHGTTLHGTDMPSSVSAVDNMVKLTLFFAKDVNGGILCGVGNDSIKRLRTLTSKTDIPYDYGMFDTSPQESKNVTSTLHLTKMINYLDPGFPEMKSAYISVIRPIVDSSETKKRVPIYEINGSKWGSAGNIKWSSGSYVFASYYFPFNPFVIY